VQHQTLFVFDIETVPDTDAAPSLTGIESLDVSERRQALEDYHLEITDGKNAFLRQPFHRVVCISFLEAQILREGNREGYTLTDVRSGGLVASSEKELLQGFFRYLERNKPRLVSFNGRTFDLPVLKYRAMAHGISAPWLHLGGDKWSSYTSRYSLDWHCDLLEALSDFGASARIKLNEVCAILGLPGKTGIDGSKVAPMFDEGRLQDIRDYCETDVINTYLVYVRWQHHRGVLTTEDYQTSVAEVVMFLEEQGKEKPHFREFLQAWHAACGGAFTGRV
jgi:predicted PolB exonuclease-like 3'-5' exonuclease